MTDFVPISAVDPAAVEALLDRAFGRDRHTRTAYRLREGVGAIPELHFAAVEDGALAGTIQCWPVALHGDDGSHHALVLVGPVAVEPSRQRGGLGKELVHQALDAAVELDLDGAMMLIGDPEYYGRFWGILRPADRRLAATGPGRATQIARAWDRSTGDRGRFGAAVDRRGLTLGGKAGGIEVVTRLQAARLP